MIEFHLILKGFESLKPREFEKTYTKLSNNQLEIMSFSGNLFCIGAHFSTFSFVLSFQGGWQ